jgi:tetratricopeptide (TPR) repeat protein
MLQRHLIAIAVLVAFASPALADMGGAPPPEPSAPKGDFPTTEAMTPRQQAERLYGDAYDEIAKANKDLADGKDKNAQKKLKHAIDRAQDAVKLDSTYAEAWNLIGYAARKLSDYPRSLAAYERSLHFKPDYAAAREYLGEALIELGRVREAREQLAWLQRLNAADQAKALAGRIDAWQTAHPDSAAPAAAPATPADSTAKAPASGSGG